MYEISNFQLLFHVPLHELDVHQLVAFPIPSLHLELQGASIIWSGVVRYYVDQTDMNGHELVKELRALTYIDESLTLPLYISRQIL